MQDSLSNIVRFDFALATDLVVSRIRECIEDSKLSYAELGKATGIAKSAIHRYATGQTQKIPKENIEKIAKATGVTVRWILGLDELPDKAEQSEEELDREIIEGYSRLTDENKKIVSDLIQALLSGR